MTAVRSPQVDAAFLFAADRATEALERAVARADAAGSSYVLPVNEVRPVLEATRVLLDREKARHLDAADPNRPPSNASNG